jgi:hypothetical protein
MRYERRTNGVRTKKNYYGLIFNQSQHLSEEQSAAREVEADEENAASQEPDHHNALKISAVATLFSALTGNFEGLNDFAISILRCEGRGAGAFGVLLGVDGFGKIVEERAGAVDVGALSGNLR